MTPTRLFIVIAMLSWAGVSQAQMTVSYAQNKIAFSKLDAIRKSWDDIYLQYALSDMASGHPMKLSASNCTYEVRDNAGKLLTQGLGNFVHIDDSKLGSEEEMTVQFSTRMGEEVIAKSISVKSSPKHIKVKMAIDFPNFDQHSLASCDFGVLFTRPRFDDPGQEEELAITADQVYLDVKLKDSDKSLHYLLNNGLTQLRTGRQSVYKDYVSTIKKMMKLNPSVWVSFAPTVMYRDQSFTAQATDFAITNDVLSQMINAETLPLMAEDEGGTR